MKLFYNNSKSRRYISYTSTRDSNKPRVMKFKAHEQTHCTYPPRARMKNRSKISAERAREREREREKARERFRNRMKYSEVVLTSAEDSPVKLFTRSPHAAAKQLYTETRLALAPSISTTNACKRARVSLSLSLDES